MYEPRRLFTLAEARALLPRLSSLLLELRAEMRELDAARARFATLTPEMRGNGHAIEATHLSARIEQLIEALQQRLSQIQDLGVEVKDIAAGLVDFPSMRDGRVVYLCWHVDEADIEFWHELDAGFRGRQAL